MGRTTPQFATSVRECTNHWNRATKRLRFVVELESLPAQSARLVEQRHDERTGLDLDAADVVVFAGPQANLKSSTASRWRLPPGLPPTGRSASTAGRLRRAS